MRISAPASARPCVSIGHRPLPAAVFCAAWLTVELAVAVPCHCTTPGSCSIGTTYDARTYTRRSRSWRSTCLLLWLWQQYYSTVRSIGFGTSTCACIVLVPGQPDRTARSLLGREACIRTAFYFACTDTQSNVRPRVATCIIAVIYCASSGWCDTRVQDNTVHTTRRQGRLGQALFTSIHLYSTFLFILLTEHASQKIPLKFTSNSLNFPIHLPHKTRFSKQLFIPSSQLNKAEHACIW